MDTSKGYIPVYRSIQDHWLWKATKKQPFSKGQAWIDLLLLANHTAHKFPLGNEIVEVEAGTVVTSELKLSRRWQWSRNKVTNFLKVLESDQMITKNSTTQRTTITIVNYGIYNNIGTTKGTTKGQRKGQRGDINNNDNNEKHEYISTSVEAFFEELWKLYPKKKGKGQISTTQKKKLFTIGREEMIRAIDRYIKDTAGKNSQYIQYGSTFFNSGYKDYLDSDYEEPATNMDGFDWDSLE